MYHFGASKSVPPFHPPLQWPFPEKSFSDDGLASPSRTSASDTSHRRTNQPDIRTITKNDLEKLPLIVLTKGASTRIRLDEYCTDNNIVINPDMEFGSNTLIKDFTLAGFGIGMLTEEHIKDELEDGTLFKLNIELPLKEKYLGMIYDYSSIGYISKNFIKYIKEAITK